MKFIHTIGESGRTCKNTLNLLKYKFLMGWLALNFTDLGNVYWDNKETLEDKLIVNYLNVSNINADDMYILYDAASDERKQKSKIYKRKIDADICICSESLLKYTIKEITGKSLIKKDISIAYEYNEFGKPYLKSNNLFFNISHSSEWIAVVCDLAEVGIDIERIRPAEPRMICRLFSDEEIGYINSGLCSERHRRFTKLWTIKESYVKYIGTGLLTSLKSFRVDVSNKRIMDLCDTDNYDVIKYSKETVPNYYMSVCGKNEQALIKEIKLEDLFMDF